MVNQREIAKYVRQAGKKCSAPYRRKLIAELQNSLSDFFEDNPEHSMEDILEHFGSPEKFADEYLLAMDRAERSNLLRIAKWIKITVCVSITIIYSSHYFSNYNWKKVVKLPVNTIL